MSSPIRLFRFGPIGSERPGAYFEGHALDVSSLVGDYDERFFATGGIAELGRLLATRAHECAPLPLPEWTDRAPEGPFPGMRLGAVVSRPSKLLGIGLNFRDHALETGAELPKEPKVFMKATSALSGVYDALAIPSHASQLDYEVELAVVIGARAKCISRGEAKEKIAGYTICCDYSERDWQKNRSGQFVKGKSYDGFAPLGPFLVTGEELDPTSTRLWLTVNGESRQDASTKGMVFDVFELVSSLSWYMTLVPGDVITTGTPSGVGLGFRPPRFLRPGDRVAFGALGIGTGQQALTLEVPGPG